MAELLPARQALRLHDGLLDFLTTTFALADAPAREALRDFLDDDVNGMFKGPYLKAAMPFTKAPRRGVLLDWEFDDRPPYDHQARAFSRLSSREGRPEPTLITTGTGSGKTEAFLLPILNHCLEQRRKGITGMKALILYPMNALANDQAQRLATMLTSEDVSGNRPQASITAALYTGEAGPKRTIVTPADPVNGMPASLITDRAIIRSQAPDILLTNYKMLDQLLLRPEDQRIWEQSAESLTYLVLDEFHTYDGAQGTDVAMLLRRLGIALKAHWPARGSEQDRHTAEEWDRPLGRLTPVGTSATLGPGDDGESPKRSIVDFATQVFGETFDEGSVVTERRLSPSRWAASLPGAARPKPAESSAGVGQGLADVDPTVPLTTDAVATALERSEAAATPDEEADVLFGALPGVDLLRNPLGHPFVVRLLEHTQEATHIDDLADLIEGSAASRGVRKRYIAALFNALGHLRATGDGGRPDRSMPSTEVHLWVRAVSRIDRFADGSARFRWGEDGHLVGDDETGATRIAFPAIYCRSCGRSGWGIELAPTGLNLSASDTDIRRNHVSKEGRFRALLTASPEADGSDNLIWFDPMERRLVRTAPESDQSIRHGQLLRVETHLGADADDLSASDTCPGCHQRDSIRFVGSAIATLMSVALATLFGEPALDPGEKKALVFTDSVQDAAHRAGFISARSQTLTMRSVWRAAGAQPMTLVELVDEALRQGEADQFGRYRLLPAGLDEETAAAYWRDHRRGVRDKLRRRLLFDASLEFGLVGSYGRTLERTATMTAAVSGDRDVLLAAGRAALAETDGDLLLDQTSEGQLVAWARGILERMRTQGAILHPWLKRYLEEDGKRWAIWGGRPDRAWMPAFPEGRSAPAFPRVGGGTTVAKSLLDAVASTQSWYASWTRRVLRLSPTAGASLGRLLLEELAKRDVLVKVTSQSGAHIYGIAPERIVVSPTTDEDVTAGRVLLACTQCQSEFPVSLLTGEQLAGHCCLAANCAGTLEPEAGEADNYYRRIYEWRDARRVNAREHTSLLPADERLAHENGFKRSNSNPAAPNVLVATPTLEMGIDIGDLSSVFLASLPRSVASYVQRVGRAGRLTGNALDVAFAEGRGEFLPRLGDPLSLINGAVVPPATYLSAEEILRRQYLAFVADEQARDNTAIHPKSAAGALALPGPTPTYLGQLIQRAGTDYEARIARFLQAFTTDGRGTNELTSAAVEELVRWSRPAEGASPLAITVVEAAQAWQQERLVLETQVKELNGRLPDLESRREDSDDDARAYRETQAEIRYLSGRLGEAASDFWVAALERVGLLPNYSLVDDSVELDVNVSWIDEDRQFQAEQAGFVRSRQRALTDFAPGATFYARGLQIGVDAVDIGHQGNEVRTIRLCPTCGHAAVDAASPTTCPRCGSAGIADVGQRFETVELTKVSAYVRRDESRIDDRSDDRVQAGFSVVAAADLDPAKQVDAWYTSTDTGVKYFRGLTIRWFNLGPRRHTAPEVNIAGHKVRAPQFRICAGCGHLDKTGLSNSRDEHRPWCRLRTSPTEETRLVLLHRELVTEAALIRLPYVVALGDDPFAVPSLTAALMLGLREVYGGAPDHLKVVPVHDPSGANRQGLLVHDEVPGGTGYLAEFANQDQLKAVLIKALEVVRDCACVDEGRLSCHRCLLPFAAPHDRELTSRSAAAKHLETMLGLTPSDPPVVAVWDIQKEPTVHVDPESVLEVRFGKAFRAIAEGLQGSVTDTPDLYGNTTRVQIGARQFKLSRQVPLGHTQPDFLLSSEGLPDLVIYTDGWEYHASNKHNNIGDDARKREGVRLGGKLVLAVTSQDLDRFDQGERSPRPDWFDTSLAQRLNSEPALQHSAAARDALMNGPMALIAYWLQGPDQENLKRFGRCVATLVYAAGAPTGGNGAAGTKSWTNGPLTISVGRGKPGKMHSSAVLDDTVDLNTTEARDAWHGWLNFANATMFLHPLIARVEALSDQSQPVEAPLVDIAPPPLQGGWASILEELGEGEELIAALSAAGVEAPDGEIGLELGDGVPFDLVWLARRIAVRLEPGEAPVVNEPGWQIFGPDAAAIENAWKGTTHG